jgi:hypothetical protein
MEQPKITQTRGAFFIACRVELNIGAEPGCVWDPLAHQVMNVGGRPAQL